MDIIRIGSKIVDIGKLYREIDKIIELRCKGKTQQEIADILGVHRTFISRLEGLGEIGKGQSIALIGFPIKNKEELEILALKHGVEYTLLMTEEERNRYIQEKNGPKLFDEVLDTISNIRKYDILVSLASDKQNRLIEKLVDKDVVLIDIGNSPITKDIYVCPERLEKTLKTLREE